MSRFYDMRITIYDPQPRNLRAVKRAVEAEFGDDETAWNDWDEADGRHLFEYTATDNLGAGGTEDSFANRVAHAVWDANDAFCEVVVSALCLEDLPREEHTRGKEEFERWSVSRDTQPMKEKVG